MLLDYFESSITIHGILGLFAVDAFQIFFSTNFLSAGIQVLLKF
ncbi:hypothetical protein MtrunA17_Chr4g0011121 [Medicago truncatula]|uniref:Transmembrane protein n=1 Tax=Medicago truncatula TaxID=3880 RepID=A0A396I0U6_MEDTR|nr:hypothetical protein MtrunA17_Chr4g0011121 [Medicago truncatula]